MFVPKGAEKTKVVLQQKWDVYNAGETVGVPPATAADLIAAKFATPVGERLSVTKERKPAKKKRTNRKAKKKVTKKAVSKKHPHDSGVRMTSTKKLV